MLALLISEGAGVVVKSGLECTLRESDVGFLFTVVLSFYCSLVNYSYGLVHLALNLKCSTIKRYGPYRYILLSSAENIPFFLVKVIFLFVHFTYNIVVAQTLIIKHRHFLGILYRCSDHPFLVSYFGPRSVLSS